MTTVTLSSRARRDVRRLDPPVRKRRAEALRQLGEEPPPDNLDIKRIAGAPAGHSGAEPLIVRDACLVTDLTSTPRSCAPVGNGHGR